jgi:hypothetical protein
MQLLIKTEMKGPERSIGRSTKAFLDGNAFFVGGGLVEPGR